MSHAPLLAVITRGDNDLLHAIRLVEPRVDVFRPEELRAGLLDAYPAIALLGGTEEDPLLFPAHQRVVLEKLLAQGKRVFAEYTASIGHVYCEPPQSTRYQRLVYCSKEIALGDMPAGALLDDQCGLRIRPYAKACTHHVPMLQFAKVHGHDRIALDDAFYAQVSDRALWFERPDELLICVFRLSPFVRARYAPVQRIRHVVAYVIGWLLGRPVTAAMLDALRPMVRASIRHSKQKDWSGHEGIMTTGTIVTKDATVTKVTTTDRGVQESRIAVDCAVATVDALDHATVAAVDSVASEVDAVDNKASEAAFMDAVTNSACRAINWFERSGVLYDEGRTGVHEGLGTEIYGDGTQRMSRLQRADCIGETAMAFTMHHWLTGEQRSRVIGERLNQYVFDYFLCTEHVPWSGMMRWHAEAWGLCFQDDAARAILPQLWQCFVEGSDDHLDECVMALNFLLKTTGSDGTRVSRTEAIMLEREPTMMQQLRREPAEFPSAHYNAYYYAALLMAYQLTGLRLFLDAGQKGLEALMAVYPDTIREQSQTQELCRLILPLSWLYWATQQEVHRDWLYRVTADLQTFKHPSGAYLEWDEGYKALMRPGIGNGESSLIAENGNPVVDLLYSNNWLPMAWMQAYFVTEDPLFIDLWQDSAAFVLEAQIDSSNAQIDGAWARAYDVELGEVFGSLADVGWGPWAIESGWTVAELASGLMAGVMKEKLVAKFREHAEATRNK
ncbi:hypothetical protein [Paenibacillus sp. 481]|uniref:hypothetical protein n=1 Tax=Paenibacillus sp. 481 TaxID=2835869 RepID=UPI001E2A9C01|nr:hypothetical protein [Paenibacillus sp. 481]UHA72173.1 hypothetical protein KIK04_15890 [Paenibacillus sp. 481]